MLGQVSNAFESSFIYFRVWVETSPRVHSVWRTTCLKNPTYRPLCSSDYSQQFKYSLKIIKPISIFLSLFDPSIPWLNLRHSIILLIQFLIAVVPRTWNANQQEHCGYENVIYTESRWVLKGQICNLLLLRMWSPPHTHLAAAEKMGLVSKKRELWIIKSNHVTHTVHFMELIWCTWDENKYF